MPCENFKQRWIRLQEENPGMFRARYIIPGRIFVVFLIVVVTKFVEKGLPQYDIPNCMIDFGHQRFQSINDKLTQNASLAYYLQSLYTLFFDFSLIFYGIIWIKSSQSTRLPLALVIFYFWKIIYDASVELTPPEHMYWVEEGNFPSIFINKRATFNFTCALVPGVYAIFMMDNWAYCFKTSKATLLYLMFTLFNVYTCFYVIFAQIHWSTDLVSGIFTGIFSWYSGKWLADIW